MLWDPSPSSLGAYTHSGYMMDRLGVLSSAFLGVPTWFSMESVQSFILAARVQRLYFLTASCCLVCLASSCHNVCEVVSHLSCDLHFLCICNQWRSFVFAMEL